MSRKSPSIEERVKAYFKGIDKGRTLLVAVSGGTDSICLLHVLSELAGELDMKLQVAHLDHMLRDESAADAEYVTEFTSRLGIPTTLDRVDVHTYRKEHKLSFEEAAREVRYMFLADTVKFVGAYAVAVGHTSDDNVETVLMHILRGSGTRGLRGLQPYTQVLGVEVVRPLLNVSRAETTEYCRRHKLEPRQDATNLSLKPFRNRIRHELLPILKQYNPQIEEAVLRTACITTGDIEFIDTAVVGAREEVVQEESDCFTLNKEGFKKLHPSLQRGLLRSLVGELLGDLMDIEAGHIEVVLSALDKQAGKKITILSGLSFAIEYNRYLLGREPLELSLFPSLEDEHRLNIPGDTAIPGWRVKVRLMTKPLTRLDKFVACMDLDKIGERLTVRTRKRGDRFVPMGLGEETRVGRFMINARIPQTWRDNIPLVCSDNRITWVVGYRIDDRVKVMEGTNRVLCLEFKRLEA